MQPARVVSYVSVCVSAASPERRERKRNAVSVKRGVPTLLLHLWRLDVVLLLVLLWFRLLGLSPTKRGEGALSQKSLHEGQRFS